MRPTPGGDPAVATPRSRKSSIADSVAPMMHSPSGGPTDFFLASGEVVEKRRDEAAQAGTGDEGRSPSASLSKSKDSMYGVQSLEDALSEAFGVRNHAFKTESIHGTKAPVVDQEQHDNDAADLPSTASPSDRKAPGISAIGVGHLGGHPVAVSQPLTPLQTASPAPDWSSNMPSTPKSGSLGSLRLSDGDSQTGVEESGDEGELRSGTVELVMPSLAMPARRPFTERGRRMGRLKVCVAGRQGVGKTSLIRAIVRQCEDIVHVDPLTTSASPNQHMLPAKSKGKEAKSKGIGTTAITEISASTKSYPSWWADIEEAKSPRRRRSSGDTVLERNLCFVDTPGFQASLSSDSDIESLIRYIEESFWRNDALAEMTDSERLSAVSGNGGTLVDAIIYVFTGADDIADDIEYFRRLSTLTNVIPVIGKADELQPDEIRVHRARILQFLKSASAKPFLFGKVIEDVIDANYTFIPHLDNEISPATSNAPVGGSSAGPSNPENTTIDRNTQLSPPFAISSLPGSDSLEMDASLLMSPSYSPPLLQSDLSSLVDLLFDPEMISWLRHSAGRRFLAWRELQLSAALSDPSDSMAMGNLDPLRRSRLQRLTGEMGHRASSPGHMVLHRPVMANPSSYPSGPGFSFTSRWADDLHRNGTALNNMPHPDRARWLLEQIHEEVSRGTIGVFGDGPATTRFQAATLNLPAIPGAEANSALTKHTPGASRSSRRRRPLSESELPAWARSGEKRRRSKNVDPHDPLGLCGAWDVWGKMFAWGVGGGVVVGALWVVVKGWYVAEGWRGWVVSD